MVSTLSGRVVLALALATETVGVPRYVISTAAGGAPTPTPVTALSAAVQPVSVAADDSGNLYFSSSQSVFKVDANGVLTRLAGTGRRGFSGDGGPALDAQLCNPGAIAIAGNGDLYVADIANNRIRKVTVAGIITTVAGTTPFNNYSGDGGPAIEAELFYPAGVAIDAAGNLYIADSGNHRIRKVSTDGTIETIAGNGLAGNSGDGGPAAQAAIGAKVLSLQGLTVDASGVYLAVDSLIRKVSPDGIITTVAGTGTAGSAGDGGLAVDAQLVSPSAVAVDNAGDLYIADHGTYVLGVSVIRKVSAGGIITTIAGGSTGGFSGDGGPAAAAKLSVPAGVAVDRDGSLFIADAGNNRLRKVSAGGIVNSIAGNGLTLHLGDGGPATGAQLTMPSFVAVDRGGNLLISDFADQRVRLVSSSGVITTVAGVGGPLVTGAVRDGQPAISAHLGRVGGVVADAKGDIFIADTDNICVWKVTPDGLIARVAGNGYQVYSGDSGPALQAGFVTPWGLALDSAGNLYIADENDQRIRKVSTNGIISTVAGNGIRGFSGDGGPATKASLGAPQSVAVDANGDLYIADHDNARIRKVSSGGTISTVAGNGSVGWVNDGMTAASAPMGLPFGIALDSAGNLYFSDGLIHKVSRGGVMTTIAGDLYLAPSYSYSGDGGPATAAGFTTNGLAAGRDGTIYLADGYNGAVRLLQPKGPSLGHNPERR